MMASLVITLMGQDRPGLVRSLAEKVAAFDGNWLESHMARLADKFVGIVCVSISKANADALATALQGLESQGLQIRVEEGTGKAPIQTYHRLKLDLVGQDRPGIVRDISSVLAGRGVSIEELITERINGSWSGESLFQASARLLVPQDVATDELREILEGLANELMVDITLDEVPVV